MSSCIHTQGILIEFCIFQENDKGVGNPYIIGFLRDGKKCCHRWLNLHRRHQEHYKPLNS